VPRHLAQILLGCPGDDDSRDHSLVYLCKEYRSTAWLATLASLHLALVSAD
jgi:hypothetical protein